MVFIKQQISESEHNDMLLDSYVTHIHTHHCSRCGDQETFSQIFEVLCHPTKTRTTKLTSLRPVVGLELKPLNLAVIQVPSKLVPICHRCAGSYKVVGKPEIITVQSSNDRWQETLRRKYSEPAKEAAKPPTAPKAVPTLDQI